MRGKTPVHGAGCPRAARRAPYGDVAGPARYSIRFAASVSEKTIGMSRYGSAPISSHTSRNSWQPYGTVPLSGAKALYSLRRGAEGEAIRGSGEAPGAGVWGRRMAGFKEGRAGTKGSREAGGVGGAPFV